MAYFHCLIGGGSSGGGYELTVTCDADFAGTTITCTDGVTTLTQTCPSASPYEVVFEIPNGGEWTISGVVGGLTVSTEVNIPTSASLFAIFQQTVTIHSAKEDTITYTDIFGDTQTEVFSSGESSKSISVDIYSSGSSITFTSSIAKDLSDLTADYSKTVTIDSNTTDVYIMPDHTLYWYGNEIEAITTARQTNAGQVNKNTNNIEITGRTQATNSFAQATTQSAVDLTGFTKINSVFYCSGDVPQSQYNFFRVGFISGAGEFLSTNATSSGATTSKAIYSHSISTNSSAYPGMGCASNAGYGYFCALWLE